MKLLSLSLSVCFLLFLPILARAEETATETLNLPELPDVKVENHSNQEAPLKKQPMPQLPEVQPSTPRPQMTREQIDAAKKDQNWLMEGMKEKKAQATRMEKKQGQMSLIDEILKRNREQIESKNHSSTTPETENNHSSLSPALSTTAFEPLADVSTASPQPEKKQVTVNDLSQAYDDKTGIQNVFYDSKTGTFQPFASHAQSEHNLKPQLEQPWQQSHPASVRVAVPEEKKVLDFEMQMIEQAKARNMIPGNYNPNPLLPGASNSHTMATNSSTGDSTLFNRNISNIPPAIQSQVANKASVAKLQMIENERQKKLAREQQPKPEDLHGSFYNRGIEINPRFD